MAGVRHMKEVGYQCCTDCPMSSNFNRIGEPCWAFIREIGGENIRKEASKHGYHTQEDAIEYMIIYGNPERKSVRI